jgi:thiol-disulfide isomerase/thioredoxin
MVTLQAAMMAMLLSNPGQVELLDFYADWCAPCRAMQPTIEALQAKGYPVKKVNITQNQQLATQYGVQSVPCYILVVDGKEVERVMGGTSFSRLEKMFKTAGAAANRPGRPNDIMQNGSPATFAANDAVPRSPNAPGGAIAIPPAGMFSDANVTPATATLPMTGMPNQQSPSSGNFNLPAEQMCAPLSDAQLIAASVRIRVEDPSGHSCGSGTIIDARGGKALVLTCGHLFRDSQGKGRIEVELFGPHAGQKVEGRLESYDSETRDIGLISIQMQEPIVAARLAPVGYSVRKSDAVASVGCDHGADPTVRRNRVKSPESSTLWVDDQPTEGRSGGGLFSAEGYVIGVCKGCDPQDHEGCYPGLSQICAQLDQAGLPFIYKAPQGWERSPAANPEILLATHNVPPMPAEMPGMNPSNGAPRNTAPLMASPSTNMNSGEQAALDEIHRHLKDGAEVVCVIRPRNTPGAKSEVIMIDKASPELVRQLSAEAQGKDGVRCTSLEVARPRKKLLEWSLSENAPQTAP